MSASKDIVSVARPDAPYQLDDAETTVWQRVVGGLPADWFGAESWGDLANYCRHEVRSNLLAQWLQKVQQQEDIDIGEYNELLKMAERESRAMASLAIRLRIAPSATFSKQRGRGAGNSVKPPWESSKNG